MRGQPRRQSSVPGTVPHVSQRRVSGGRPSGGQGFFEPTASRRAPVGMSGSGSGSSRDDGSAALPKADRLGERPALQVHDECALPRRLEVRGDLSPTLPRQVGGDHRHHRLHRHLAQGAVEALEGFGLQIDDGQPTPLDAPLDAEERPAFGRHPVPGRAHRFEEGRVTETVRCWAASRETPRCASPGASSAWVGAGRNGSARTGRKWRRLTIRWKRPGSPRTNSISTCCAPNLKSKRYPKRRVGAVLATRASRRRSLLVRDERSHVKPDCAQPWCFPSRGLVRARS